MQVLSWIFKRSRTSYLLLITLPLMLVAACASSDASEQSRQEPRGELMVAAAADLQPALGKIKDLFQKETGVQVNISFGSSGLLATQIEQGAPFDIYISAHVRYVDQLTQRGYAIADTRTVYAIGRLALVSGKGFKSLEDLLRPDVQHIAIANPEHAPYGRAAEETLRSTNIWQQVQNKLVFGENVRQAFQFVETGQAEAGIVALALAIASGADYEIIDTRLHQPIIQGAAVVDDSDQKVLAQLFLDFLRQSEAQQVFARYGFLPPQ